MLGTEPLEELTTKSTHFLLRLICFFTLLLIVVIRTFGTALRGLAQLEMMRQGGNGQIKRFFRRLEIATAAISELYNSQAAEHYRKKLEERVDKICSGEVKSHVRIFHKVRSTSNDSNKSVEELSRVTASNIYSVKFGLGPLGITLTKDYNGEAVISRVVAGSPAETAGIQPGDYVKGVANIFSDKYDDIMNMICTSPRPFTILLLRCSSHPLPYTSSALNVNASSAAGTITRERSSPRMQADQRKSLPGDAPSFLKDTVRSISTESAGKDDLVSEGVGTHVRSALLCFLHCSFVHRACCRTKKTP